MFVNIDRMFLFKKRRRRSKNIKNQKEVPKNGPIHNALTYIHFGAFFNPRNTRKEIKKN